MDKIQIWRERRTCRSCEGGERQVLVGFKYGVAISEVHLRLGEALHRAQRQLQLLRQLANGGIPVIAQQA